jgi:hypothetical protein
MKPARLQGPFGLLATIAGVMMASMLLPNGCTIDAEQSHRLREVVPVLTPLVFLLLAHFARRSRVLAVFGITVLAELLWTAIVTITYAAKLSGLRELGFALVLFSPELLCLLVATTVIAWSARRELVETDLSARAARRAGTWAMTTLAAALIMSTRLVLCAGKEHLDQRLVLIAYGFFAILLAITVAQRGRDAIHGYTQASVVPAMATPMSTTMAPDRHALVARGCVLIALVLTVFGLLAFAALPA